MSPRRTTTRINNHLHACGHCRLWLRGHTGIRRTESYRLRLSQGEDRACSESESTVEWSFAHAGAGHLASVLRHSEDEPTLLVRWPFESAIAFYGEHSRVGVDETKG